VNGSIGIVSIMDKMRENRLRWFGYMIRRAEIKAVRVIMKINVERIRRRGKNRDGWIQLKMSVIGVCVGDIKNQDEWREV
jgi:hypothetical protein